MLAAWYCEKTSRLHQNNGVRQSSITGVILCVKYVRLNKKWKLHPKISHGEDYFARYNWSSGNKYVHPDLLSSETRQDIIFGDYCCEICTVQL